ncbi:MAG: PadR family transcriptional regulator [Dehalococcoidia bacterium]
MVVESRRSQMLKGILDPCLLAVLAEREAYGYDIVTRLAEAGLREVAEGTVYPALMRLEQRGLLAWERRPSDSGPPRKYYRLTETGHNYLAEWKSEWIGLANAVDDVLGTSKPKRAKETA